MINRVSGAAMSAPEIAKLCGALILGLAVSGCETGGETPQANPMAAKFNYTANGATGTYNPTGWSASEIKTEVVSGKCGGKNLASYSETPKSNGLIAFEAICT